MEPIPDFVREYVRKQLRDMRRGMRIKFIIPEADLANLILEHIQLEPVED
jgi:hypothetical protein